MLCHFTRLNIKNKRHPKREAAHLDGFICDINMAGRRIQTQLLAYFLILLCAIGRVQSFCTWRTSPSPQRASYLRLVTEDDVIKAVEKAEELWAKALEARKTANALSDRAEEEAEASSARALAVEAKLKDNNISKTPITMETLAEGDAVARSSLDAGLLVNRALAASEEAERLLQQAEEALEQSESTLEQHLIDFPDSSLGE